MEARYYKRFDDLKVKCNLCPHECIIMSDHSGICRVRTNEGGVLSADMYGAVAAMQFDPVEKKPLYHFHPGREILSLGSLGCNFHCSCCQNYEISQTGRTGFPRLQILSIPKIISTASANPDNIGVAYTYNEPTIGYEFMYDIAAEIHRIGLKNVMVSNGYINQEPLTDLLPFIDAFNIDIKGADKKIHKKFTGGNLEHVLETISAIIASGKHLEITFLVVPGINDDLKLFEKMIEWISTSTGKDTALHISRYFPRFRMNTESTSLQTLNKMAELASKSLSYVYLGNTAGEYYQDTICPGCGSLMIKRNGYQTSRIGISIKGNCSYCGHIIAIG
jgi:pyruvate formate lyase activating enzyme